MWSIAEIIHIFLYWNQALQKGQEILLLSLRRLFEKGVWNDTLVIDIVFQVSKKNDPYYIWPQFKLWRGSYIYVHSRFGFHAKQVSEVYSSNSKQDGIWRKYRKICTFQNSPEFWPYFSPMGQRVTASTQIWTRFTFHHVKFPTPLCFNFYYFDVVFDSFYALLARTSFHALITLILVHDRGSQ